MGGDLGDVDLYICRDRSIHTSSSENLAWFLGIITKPSFHSKIKS